MSSVICGVVYASHVPGSLVNRLSKLFYHFHLLETEQQLVDFLSYDATWLSGKDLAVELADTVAHIESQAFVSTLVGTDQHIWHILLLSPQPERKYYYRCWNADEVGSPCCVVDCISSIVEGALDSLLGIHSNSMETMGEDWQMIPFVSPLERLLRHQIPYCVWLPKYQRLSCFPRLQNVIIFPGSFHPLHRGHIELAKAAGQLSQRCVVFELSIENADKGKWSKSQVMERLSQFTSSLGYLCVLTVEPLFYKKAQLFPGAFFVVGVDTAQRMVDLKYYNHNYQEMITCLQPLMESGTKILVAGRIQDPCSNTGRYLTLQDVSIPWTLQSLFYPIPQELFRCDISSTMLRNKA
ncbi:hypothetical protein GpartN1_g2702.t1 [Galdieria partita]|uniref:Cytidyltransferase-like domain-containing protein n=1 Tax=Galdieria partita TaxID=83374 RepID=A0A9C7PV13_9RHOD|nr:hypothetical protein GpartN1_g2702.t1 [Galdieria partita]